MEYQKHFSTRTTPQAEAIPGSVQVANSAGGFSWAVDDWTRLDRFLVLGSEGGSYYASGVPLTRENAEAVLRCVKADGARTVARIVEISEAGRAPKNDPALFALAMCAKLGDEATRRVAYEALPRVARIGTHLYHFLSFVEGFGGWGRGLKRAVARWYTGRDAGKLAYDLVKYRQRDGWAHRDVLRLAHPTAPSPEHQGLFHWTVKGERPEGNLPDVLDAFIAVQGATTDDEVVAVIAKCKALPWEAIPTERLGSAKVWEALLPNLPVTALVRNLGRMTANGLIGSMSAAGRIVAERLADEGALRKARLHPLAVLVALKTYEQGRGERGKLTWEPVREVVDALDKAFYLSFGTVTPTGKRLLLALDVSGSMGGPELAGMVGITPRVGSAAMALVTANVEKQYEIVGFTAGQSRTSHAGYGAAITRLAISPRQRLDDAVRTVSGLDFGGTDCALPMLWAAEHKVPVDTFVVYTDSETWAGSVHPSQALRAYREKMGIAAKSVVVSMVPNEFTIADPDDAGMLDVVGFDTATPNVLADFAIQ